LPVSLVVACALVPHISHILKTWSGFVTSVLTGLALESLGVAWFWVDDPKFDFLPPSDSSDSSLFSQFKASRIVHTPADRIVHYTYAG
jgi:hypothetical protein